MSEKPPVRADVRSPDFDANLVGRLDIWFNGNLETEVVAYDCEVGWAEFYMKHANGRHVIEFDKLVVERVAGDVVVKFK